jgi:bifunctional non-homologous end joining protein LigD
MPNNFIRPQLADIGECKNNPGLIYEQKLDGYRAIITLKPDGYTVQARSGADKTELFPELEFTVEKPCVLDGELVCFRDGKPLFAGIQHRGNRKTGIEHAMETYPATYCVFDILELDGQNVMRLPLQDRKTLLAQVVTPTSNVKLTEYVSYGEALFAQAALQGLEGVIGKRLDQPYYEGQRLWIKCKVPQIGEFSVVGYTQGTGWRKDTFGALVLADKDNRYVGMVGTGFNDAEIARLVSLMKPTDIKPMACADIKAVTSDARTGVTFITPFKIRVKYLEATADNRLRFPSYQSIISEGA